jgi:hypothetical protein
MTRHAPALRTLGRRLGAAVAVSALATTMLLVGVTETATAAGGARHWALSGVTFADGGQMTGSFVMTASGQLDDVHITTSGGDTAWFGESTTYDAGTANVYDNGADHYLMQEGSSQFIRLVLPDLSSATDGAVVDLSPNTSYECLNCSPYRYVSAGSLVASSQITLDGTPTLSGLPKAGQTLTFDDSAVTTVPQDTTRTYQWLRDGQPVEGATAASYALTAADVAHSISLQYGATRYGYPDALPLTTDEVGPVTADPPTVELSAATSTLRRGQTTTLTWISTDATSLTASGSWSGARADSGTATVTATTTGLTTYVLHADNDFGQATATAVILVRREAKALKVNAGDGPRRAGGKLTVATRGLDAGERYTIRIGGKRVATGKAAGGPLRRSVSIPARAHTGKVTVTVTGSERDRTGKDHIKVVPR